jgi:hypothetical protein
LLLGVSATWAVEVPDATLKPSPIAPEHQVAHQTAIAAHDAQKYAEAIELYRKILAENPDDVATIYELAYSLHASGNTAECADAARRGARYDSRLLGQLRMVWANCLDIGGAPHDAAEVYQYSIRHDSENSMLRFNYAVTLEKLERQDEALRQLKIGLTLAPGHPGSHLLLSRLYRARGYRIPAILAGVRFLILEPQSGRSQTVLSDVHDLLHGSVSKKDDGTITLSISPDADSEEGKFGGAEMMLSVMGAAQGIVGDESPEKLTPVRLASMLISSMLESAIDDNKKPRKEMFAARYYLPYFKAIQDRDEMDAVVRLVYASSNWGEVTEWLENNSAAVTALQAWSQGYDRWQGATITNY